MCNDFYSHVTVVVSHVENAETRKIVEEKPICWGKLRLILLDSYNYYLF